MPWPSHVNRRNLTYTAMAAGLLVLSGAQGPPSWSLLALHDQQRAALTSPAPGAGGVTDPGSGTITFGIPTATPGPAGTPGSTVLGVASAFTDPSAGQAYSAALLANGIPARAYQAYVAAAEQLAIQRPQCGLSWSVLAGIGRVESDHGRYSGSSINAAGVVTPGILGVRLDGSIGGTAVIRDTDGGRWDGDRVYDRAVGPMQFLPGTWRLFGAGADPQNMQAAAVAAGRYLCANDASMRTAAGRWAAVYRYNHSDSYVSTVLALADSYLSGRPVAPTTRPAGTSTSNDGGSAAPAGDPPAVTTTPPPVGPISPSSPSSPASPISTPSATVTTSPDPAPSASVTPTTTPPVTSPTTGPTTTPSRTTTPKPSKTGTPKPSRTATPSVTASAPPAP